MLKGWFDRIWAPGVDFDHTEIFGPIRPRLVNVSNVMVVTTLGASWWIDRVILRQPLKRIIKYALLGACAPAARLSYLSLYNAEKVDDARIAKFLRRVDRTLKSWE